MLSSGCQVKYDAQLGYPASIYIDLDEHIADEEISYAITALQIKHARA